MTSALETCAEFYVKVRSLGTRLTDFQLSPEVPTPHLRKQLRQMGLDSMFEDYLQVREKHGVLDPLACMDAALVEHARFTCGDGESIDSCYGMWRENLLLLYDDTPCRRAAFGAGGD